MQDRDVNKYKMDDRTEEEFIADMVHGLQNEVFAINRFKEILNKSNVENPEIVHVGSDIEGKICYDEGEIANIDLFPDYLLKYKEDRKIRFKFVEVKICNPHSDYAYFKVKQLNQYKELGSVLILFVMGWETKYPLFILVSPDSILQLGIKPEMIYGKETIKVHVTDFDWEIFNIIQEGHVDLLHKKYIKSYMTKKKER